MKSALLGPNGKPLALAMRQEAPAHIQASFDVGWTTNQNAAHWAFARSGDAQIAFDFEMRRRSRLRARYECANNPHLRGMVDTKAADLVGCVGLQVLTDEGQEIERAWNAWAQEICLHDKLQQLIGPGKMTDGEGIAVQFENPHLYNGITLDLMLIEAEQMGNRLNYRDDHRNYDGVRHDKGFPRKYYIYDWNPDSNYRFNPAPYIGRWYPPDRVIHLFRRFRAGQLRGATELGPCLEFAAIMRRYTLATLGAAESAAEQSMVMHTEASPECPAEEFEDAWGETVPWVRNQLYTVPYGWKISQMKAEQPVETYHAFIRSIVTQMGRSLGIPAVLCFGDSSEYNMASGRLDVQQYVRALHAERKALLEPQCLEKIFAMWMRYYNGADSATLREEYPHRWTYRPINHSDPEKQAKADAEMWHIGLLTDDEYLYSHNIDPQMHYEQLKEQNKRRQELGMPAPGMMPGMPTAGQSQGPGNDQQQDSSTETEA